jgi:hypothetical protein
MESNKEVSEEVKPDLIKFLLGESAYKGLWYGSRDKSGALHWWREDLRFYSDAVNSALEAKESETTSLREENKRLKEQLELIRLAKEGKLDAPF